MSEFRIGRAAESGSAAGLPASLACTAHAPSTEMPSVPSPPPSVPSLWPAVPAALEKREAYCRQQVAARVRSGRERLRVPVRHGFSIVDVAVEIGVSVACVGQRRSRQHPLGRLRSPARAGGVIVGDGCFEPPAQIAGRGGVRGRSATLCCGDVAVDAGLGGRTLPLPCLVAGAPAIVFESRPLPGCRPAPTPQGVRRPAATL